MIIYMQTTIDYLATLKKLPEVNNNQITELKEIGGGKYFKITNK